MKKLLTAAIALIGGVSAAIDISDASQDVRVYQMDLNVYTTKGAVTSSGATSPYAEAEKSVMRKKDKTVIRGILYGWGNDIRTYQAVFCDVRRKGFFEDLTSSALSWNLINIFGAKGTDVECAWTFEGGVDYGNGRVQKYVLAGKGYGTVKKSGTGYLDNLTGYFSGLASAPYDLTANDGSGLTPSSALAFDSLGALEFRPCDTVAFGMWKLRYNANFAKACQSGRLDFTALKGKLLK